MNNHPYKSVSIILFEDDDVDAMGIQREFQKQRLANPIFRVKDGMEGLELMRSNKVRKPYLVLLDLNMPRMNGLETLKELRKDPQLTQSVVFVLTTSKDDEDVLAAYREHIAGYIVKPGLGNSFKDIFQFLDHYWRLIELPSDLTQNLCQQ